MHVKFARHVCKHTSCAWQVLQFSALVDLFDWTKLLCHRDLAVKDGRTSTAHWLQWFPPQLGADALGIGVSQLSYPNGVHMVFCAQANAGIDPGISPVPLVLPVLLSRLVWSLKLSLMTKVYVTSRISGTGMSFWWYLKPCFMIFMRFLPCGHHCTSSTFSTSKHQAFGLERAVEVCTLAINGDSMVRRHIVLQIPVVHLPCAVADLFDLCGQTGIAIRIATVCNTTFQSFSLSLNWDHWGSSSRCRYLCRACDRALARAG